MSIKIREQNVRLSRTFKNIRNRYGLDSLSVCDIGCGYGEYLRFFGNKSVGVTTTEEEIVYGEENNLPIIFGNAEKIDEIFNSTNFQAIWANNLFEHLLSPHSFLIRLKKISSHDAILILGVPVVPKITLLLFFKFFRGSLASNHISFFTSKTLHLTVERAGWDILSARPFVFNNIFLDYLAKPFAPHLYVVARNNINFRYAKKKMKEWVNDPHYSNLLDITNQRCQK